MSDTPIAGTHHLTAIASGPQRNVDFYTEVLGLGLVKRTVSFDDPARITFTSVTRPGRQAAF